MKNPALGFVGLGIMGRPQCRNLLKAGYPVTVWNRSRPGVEALLPHGAREGESPADVAARSEIVITMVSDSPDVEQVVLGPGGISEGARPGGVVIDMSTISPRVTREIAGRLAEREVELLDAPVSGGEVGAISGTLSIMVGGKEEVFERCRPVLAAMGKNIVYQGPSGAGQTTKLCNQVAVVLSILAMCESLILAGKAGVDPSRVLEAIRGGSAGSWMLEHLAPQILAGNHDPGFMVRLQQKDLRLVLELAEEIRLPLPGTALVQQLFRAVEAEGGGDLGTQSLIKTLEKLANHRLQDK